jgi:hypothetical protein
MQDLIRKRPGVLETRVGYSGGDVPNATYRNHGTHAEAIEIIFDDEVTDYRSILEFFSRSMTRRPRIGRVTTRVVLTGRRFSTLTMSSVVLQKIRSLT